jgi:hypothetical protein
MARLLRTWGLCVLISFCATSVHAQQCSSHNYPWGGLQKGTDWTGHGTGQHTASPYLGGTCNYTPILNSKSCEVSCQSTSSTSWTETGLLLNPFLAHGVNYAPVQGGASGVGAQTCGAESAVGVRACVFLIGCTIGVSVNFPGSNGIGGSVSYTAASIWSPTFKQQTTCPAQSTPNCYASPEPGDPGGTTDGYWGYNIDRCFWYWIPIRSSTPIIIDTDGSGFHLTSAPQGIKWDFYGNGKPIQIAWTQAGSTNGWLAIDLNGNGKIDSAKELFGNASPQPDSGSDPNGFKALAVYDLNHDGVINQRDAVWSKLLEHFP